MNFTHVCLVEIIRSEMQLTELIELKHIAVLRLKITDIPTSYCLRFGETNHFSMGNGKPLLKVRFNYQAYHVSCKGM